jgi:hypothetical protein
MAFDKIKAFTASFSQVKDFEIFDSRFLLVLWEIGQPYRYSIDLIELKTWERTVANFVPPEGSIDVGNDLIYVTERRESDDLDIYEEVYVHSYQLEE